MKRRNKAADDIANRCFAAAVRADNRAYLSLRNGKETFFRQYSSADGYLYDRLLILTASILVSLSFDENEFHGNKCSCYKAIPIIVTTSALLVLFTLKDVRLQWQLKHLASKAIAFPPRLP